MSSSISFRALRQRVALLSIAFMAAAHADAATVTVRHTFDAVTIPSYARYLEYENDLIRGDDGNFYGTAYFGGTNNSGTIFKITPGGSFTILHDFSALADADSSGRGTNGDGAHPVNALIPGTDGNFYGVTAGGGNRYGTFFRITPGGAFTPLYSFSATDPTAGIHQFVRGNDGNFYGTNGVSTYEGSIPGTVFRFTPEGSLTIVHSFNALPSPYSNVNDGGASPNALLLGSDGNFYGTTIAGGANGAGTVFKMTAAGAITTLYTFNALYSPSGVMGVNNGGGRPIGRLTQGSDGNFYGACSVGDYYGSGNLFKITPGGGLSRLYVFGSASQGENYDDGGFPVGNLVQGSNGNFYGTASYGKNFTGVIFELTPGREYHVLHAFAASANQYDASPINSDGFLPLALVEGSKGVFYGLSSIGGTNGAGVVTQFDLHPDFFAAEVPLGNEVYYLSFPGNGNIFGYYEYLSDPRFIYHFDMGFEYVFDAADGNGGVYLYDFTSSDFFYTSPTFPFPYLYDFNLAAFLYYYPDPTNPQRYNTNGVRYFYDFSTGKIISK